MIRASVSDMYDVGHYLGRSARIKLAKHDGYRQKGWSYVLILAFAVGAVVCALQAVRSRRLRPAAIWLAGVSALTSMLLYSFGAREVAVVELSVGAGLVVILFVFAISLAGEPSQAGEAVVPAPLAVVGIGLVLLFLGELVWPRIETHAIAVAAPLSTVLWQDRQMDVFVQIVLIFAGALTIVGLFDDEARTRAVATDDEQAQSTPGAPEPLTRPVPLARPVNLIPGPPRAAEPVADPAGWQKENIV